MAFARAALHKIFSPAYWIARQQDYHHPSHISKRGVIMAEHKGKGTKGATYDEDSGVGTSRGGVTGTTGNLNSRGHDGGIGMPPVNDDGNRQNADVGEHGDTPALGRTHRAGNRQRAQGGSASGEPGISDEESPGPENKQTDASQNFQGGSIKRR